MASSQDQPSTSIKYFLLGIVVIAIVICTAILMPQRLASDDRYDLLRKEAIFQKSEPISVEVASIAETYEEFLEAKTYVGRNFTEDDFSETAAPVAIITQEIMSQLIESSNSFIFPGSLLRIGGREHTIIGILSPEFELAPYPDIWLPRAQETLN